MTSVRDANVFCECRSFSNQQSAESLYEVTWLPIYAFIDKRNFSGNTGSSLWGLALKLVAMSSVQNGSKRPVSETFDVACKVMLLGDSGVGKTCVLVRFKDGAFLSGSFISTVGIDYKNKVVDVDGTRVKLQIWDTAGQERFRSITHAYYRDSQALLLLYDVTSESSFENIRAWLSEIYEYASSDVIIMLLGNKADLTNQRVISREQGEQLAKTHNVAFMETSAKSGLNVDLAFMAVARDIKHRSLKRPSEPKFNIEQYVESQREKPDCCS